MYLGCDGRDAGAAPVSMETRAGGEDVSEVFESASADSGGESLRFLWGDVVKVTALFPYGNKALGQKNGLCARNGVGEDLYHTIKIEWKRCCRWTLTGCKPSIARCCSWSLLHLDSLVERVDLPSYQHDFEIP